MSPGSRRKFVGWLKSNLDAGALLAAIASADGDLLRRNKPLRNQLRRIDEGRRQGVTVHCVPNLRRVSQLAGEAGLNLLDFIENPDSCPYLLGSVSDELPSEEATAALRELAYQQVKGLMFSVDDGALESVDRALADLKEVASILYALRDVPQGSTTLATQALRHRDRVLRQSAAQLDACTRDLQEVAAILEASERLPVNDSTTLGGNDGSEAS